MKKQSKQQIYLFKLNSHIGDLVVIATLWMWEMLVPLIVVIYSNHIPA